MNKEKALIQKELVLGFIKYKGNLVNEGAMDAKKSAEVLLGIDQVLRFFMELHMPELSKIEYEIPVRIKKGSWVAETVESILENWWRSVGLIAVTKYFGSALSEMAKNDIKDKGIKDIFKYSFESIVKVIKLAKHLGSLEIKKIQTVKFHENNTIATVKNADNEELDFPVNIIDLYIKCPPNLFNKLASVIEDERELKIGYGNLEDNSVSISNKFKYVFSKEEDTEEIVLPELKHGEYVELEGHITRGNENSNTIGFQYKGHIITSFPSTGKINNYKDKLFTNCLIKGIVERIDKNNVYKEKKPRIKFYEIVSNEKPKLDLFSEQ